MARKNWMTALACCALLALGACSSSGDKKTAGAPGQGPGPALAVGSVEAAEKALNDARTAVAAAEMALNAAVLPTDDDSAASEASVAVSQADDDPAQALKESARAALEVARTALEDAVAAAEAAVAAAGEDDTEAAEVLREANTFKETEPLKLVELTVDVWDAEEAVTAAGDDVTLTQKQALRQALKTAQENLDEAVKTSDAEDDLKTALSDVVDDAKEVVTSLAWAKGAGLTPGDASAAVVGTVPVAKVDRHPRTKPGGAPDGWTELDIKDEGVAYAEGDVVMSPNGDGTTKDLKARAFTTRQFIFEQGKNAYDPLVGNMSGEIKTSIQLTEDGLVMKTGGDVVSYDMQRKFTEGKMDDWFDGVDATSSLTAGATDMTADHLADLEKLQAAGTDVGTLPESATGKLDAKQVAALQNANIPKCWVSGVKCGNWAHDDLEITFGEPSQASDGSAVWHWSARAPLGPGQDASKIAALKDRHDQDLGQYDLWLSNYAGSDESNAADKNYRYLSHAAYGMFQQIDNVSPWTTRPEYVRSQAFHIGYDAFSEAYGARTKDLSGQIGGTFKGRTMAHALYTKAAGKKQRPDRFESLRGDIELDAKIGGTGSDANTIKGAIENLQYFDNNRWNNGYEVSKVELSGLSSSETAQIADDGSYKGTATADTEGAKIYTSGGTFEGNFYGPKSKPETAGWWQLSDTANGEAKRRIIGSYGAVCTEGCGN